MAPASRSKFCCEAWKNEASSLQLVPARSCVRVSQQFQTDMILNNGLMKFILYILKHFPQIGCPTERLQRSLTTRLRKGRFEVHGFGSTKLTPEATGACCGRVFVFVRSCTDLKGQMTRKKGLWSVYHIGIIIRTSYRAPILRFIWSLRGIRRPCCVAGMFTSPCCWSKDWRPTHVRFFSRRHDDLKSQQPSARVRERGGSVW